MSCFSCPVCGRPLTDTESGLCCQQGHSFDRSRAGYVNLLRSQQSSLKRHGDDKRMLIARRDFLNRGHYAPLRDALCEAVQAIAPAQGLLADAGCGEGYYTAHLASRLPRLTVCGIDISKDALRMAASRHRDMELAVASVFALPLASRSTDVLLSVFAPTADAEFARVVKPQGYLVRVIPTARHLYGLKAAIYDQVRLNKPERTDIDGFMLCKREELALDLTLSDPDDIRHLFEMTPYYYKTGIADQQRLLALASLSTELGFAILTYQKISG